MRTVCLLALSVALSALTPFAADAQIGAGLQAFDKPYTYTDTEGPGTVTYKPLSNAPTWPEWQKIQVTWEQKGVKYTGSGVYHYGPDVVPQAQPITYLWYSVVGPNGYTYFYEGRIDHKNNPKSEGGGTYFRVDDPHKTYNWKLHVPGDTPPNPDGYVNATPSYVGNWQRIAYSEAIDGAYYAAGNSWSGWDAQVVWSGTIPRGNYDVHVYIPAKFAGDQAGRTKNATYKIAAAASTEIKADQNVPQTGWYVLAKKVAVDGSYRITLTNETGENPSGTTRVVSSAVRLVPAGP